jgi:hypothetical protein
MTLQIFLKMGRGTTQQETNDCCNKGLVKNPYTRLLTGSFAGTNQIGVSETI